MKDHVSAIIAAALKEGRNHLLEPEAKRICREYGIHTPRSKLVVNLKEALSAAKYLGFPVALKVVSRDIIHKTEAGCVMLDVENPSELRVAYTKVLRNARRHIGEKSSLAVLVERMAPPGVEVIIGGLKDQQFGHAIMFGLGGIFVELLDDIAFRVVPLDEKNAIRMISEVRGSQILRGHRGLPPADEKTLVRVLLSSSRLLEDHPEISQMDLNPAIVHHRGVIVVDARIGLER